MKILHFSDTHVSHRRFRDVRDTWKISNRVTWIEEDYCIGFKEALEIAAESDYDYVIHSGDLFDIPVGRYLAGPTEYSRTFVIKELKNFFEKTKYKIPVIIIDGNHGAYLTRNYSTIEFIQAAFPGNVYTFTNYQLKKAISDNKPLKLEFDDVVFFLFPYFKFGRAPHIEKSYEDWLRNNQQPDSSKISIAVAHGMQRGEDLHSLLLDYPYDYVALGHDHKQSSTKKNAWQSGSTEKHTFAERGHTKGVLEVEVQKGEDPLVTPRKLKTKREMHQTNITLNTYTTPSDFEEIIREKIKPYRNKFSGETATRFKIKIDGNVLLSNWWGMEDILVDIQQEVFTDLYNILEFRWDSYDLSKRAPISHEKGAKIHEYLIDDPVDDFERYIRSLGLENEDQARVFIDMGAKIIEEVFSGPIESTTEEEKE
ncbi:MAG: metallophosphoesterase [Candidatus Heimdallarchaeota archaeon]|nr:metallophosphoesterase [Candidatus Heimdallarchaeota archaeon]MCK4878392.1 metallophosphoesterase [Candidatus Heimdallarchaeota archaeon]